MRRFVCAAVGLLTLAGCANQLDPTTEVFEAQAAYNAAVSAEMAWITLAKPNAGAVRAVAAAREQANADIAPAVAQVKAGTIPSSAALLAMETALTAFQNAVPPLPATPEGSK